ncbi:MAG: exosortase system-associated protein, TIGR04073 family [Candidatus Omnitrophota bacterium]|nr:exosortase system-associated protein, TIGR04073 family [Candidatus Omnitrophota bacterium]
MRKQRWVAAGMVLWLWVTPSAWAQDPIHKMGRGVVNVLTSWIELPKQIHMGSQETNPISGLGLGLLKGAGLTVLRGGVGVYEVLTFPIPCPREFASPYEQMELPDYAWEE